jgi:hypothetical protein
LRFGRSFNQALQIGVLPEGLETLGFGEEYSLPIEAGVLPSTLQSLKLHKGYRYIDQVLSLSTLSVSHNQLEQKQQQTNNILPPSCVIERFEY